MSKWIGVDLDATLAKYDRWVDLFHIGEPILPMVRRIQFWLSRGIEVRIFTARVGIQETEEENKVIPDVIKAIEDWCELHIGKRLPVTNMKDFGMIELWDDRAIRVRTNTGEVDNNYPDIFQTAYPREKQPT